MTLTARVKHFIADAILSRKLRGGGYLSGLIESTEDNFRASSIQGLRNVSGAKGVEALLRAGDERRLILQLSPGT